MKECNDWNQDRLLQFLQGCHSILGIAWPRPGNPEMEGARVFIGTNLFASLEDGVRQADEEFEHLITFPNMETHCVIWRLNGDILIRLKALGRVTRNSFVDSAFNLLYLSTGLQHNIIASAFNFIPTPVERFSKVEATDDLLKKCGWINSEQSSPGVVLQNLICELRNVMAGLSDDPK
jgi:hypothetical protein